MSNVVYLRQQASVSESYRVEQKGPRSWWVICQPLAWDGTPTTTSRVVLFAHSDAEVQAWLAARQQQYRAPRDMARVVRA